MKRRHFITLLGGAATWPMAARAQQPDRMRRIGVLQPFAANDPDAQPRVSAFQRRMQELGWTDGRNVHIDYRWAPGGDAARLRAQAAELVNLKPDLILGASSAVTTALQAETRTIPILFVQVIDPVSSKFVASIARPGGNATGITNFEFTMGGKWLGTLKEFSPNVARAAVLYNPKTATYAGLLHSITAAAPSFAIELTDARVQDAAEIGRAIDAFAQTANGGLLVLPDPSTLVHRDLIITLASQHRLPAIYPFRYFAASGGLVSYGNDAVDQYRQVASYADRILRGTMPAELPVQAPTKFELVINLKTAKALGLTVPDKMLALADEVIE